MQATTQKYSPDDSLPNEALRAEATQTLYIAPSAMNSSLKQLISIHRQRPVPNGQIEILEKFWDFPTAPEILRAVTDEATSAGIECMIVGATARDILLLTHVFVSRLEEQHTTSSSQWPWKTGINSNT